jgi:hypothetical protein
VEPSNVTKHRHVSLFWRLDRAWRLPYPPLLIFFPGAVIVVRLVVSALVQRVC